jgi:CBS domain-containing protein
MLGSGKSTKGVSEMNDMQVKDVMSELVTTVSPEDSIHEAAGRLARNSISGMPVVAGRRVVGMVSESDIIYALTPQEEREAGMTLLDFMVHARRRDAERDKRLRVRDVMSTVVIDISAFASLWKAAAVMHGHGVKRLPVTDNEGRLIGIVSRADLVRAIARGDASIASDVREAIGALGEELFDELSVRVEDGKVTIEGKADSRSTKALAIQIAKRVPGVVEVRDGLDYVLDDGEELHVSLTESDLEELDPMASQPSATS